MDLIEILRADLMNVDIIWNKFPMRKEQELRITVRKPTYPEFFLFVKNRTNLATFSQYLPDLNACRNLGIILAHFNINALEVTSQVLKVLPIYI